jgi:hypothetical protein
MSPNQEGRIQGKKETGKTSFFFFNALGLLPLNTKTN